MNENPLSKIKEGVLKTSVSQISTADLGQHIRRRCPRGLREIPSGR